LEILTKSKVTTNQFFWIFIDLEALVDKISGKREGKKRKITISSRFNKDSYHHSCEKFLSKSFPIFLKKEEREQSQKSRGKKKRKRYTSSSSYFIMNWINAITPSPDPRSLLTRQTPIILIGVHLMEVVWMAESKDSNQKNNENIKVLLSIQYREILFYWENLS